MSQKKQSRLQGFFSNKKTKQGGTASQRPLQDHKLVCGLARAFLM